MAVSKAKTETHGGHHEHVLSVTGARGVEQGRLLLRQYTYQCLFIGTPERMPNV